jgi:yeast amino acid transporter
MAQKPLPYDDGLELAHYQGIEVHEVHEYGGMEANEYQGNSSGAGSEKASFPTAHVYEEDLRSRLHRDLKTRQIAMIALGGALGTGLLINT